MSDVKVIAVADDVGYTDEKGNPFGALGDGDAGEC